jgi:multisubunit Na+/H+ antiporter MnhG subunit
MKQAWSDLKSFVTISVVITLVALLIITAIQQNWEIFQLIFTLFSSVTASVITYFFTKKSNNEIVENNENSEKINKIEL